MTENKIRICIVDTVYSLFIYLLMNGYSKDDIFVFSSGVPKQVRDNVNHIYFPSIRLKDGLKFDEFNSLSGLYKNIKGYLSFAYGILKVRMLLFIKTFNKDVEVYGQGHITFSFPLYEYEYSFIIEDGLGNYFGLREPTYKKGLFGKILHFMGVYIGNIKEGFGTHGNIKKVFLTKDNAPAIIKDKSEIINLNQLWNSKSRVEKNKILSIFNLNDLNLNKGEDICLLLTEPFSEDNLLSYEEEIKIYSEIISKYDNIIIKTHPREKKDYSRIFPNVRIINVPFPVELLRYLNIDIKKIITICSTAVMNFDDVDIEIYDGNISEDYIVAARDYLKKMLSNN